MTTTVTVTTMTMLLDSGLCFRLRTDTQENVPMDTIIMTATNAAIGICRSQLSRNTTITMSTTPAVSVESRPLPPDFTLITDCPIIAPAIPPNSPAMMLAMPWPLHSRFRSLSVSVRSSTIVAVISDSSSPTTARPAEYGRMIMKVSNVSGTSGHKKIGKVSGSEPMSPTVRTSIPKAILMVVSSMMQTNGEGMSFPTMGIIGNR